MLVAGGSSAIPLLHCLLLLHYGLLLPSKRHGAAVTDEVLAVEATELKRARLSELVASFIRTANNSEEEGVVVRYSCMTVRSTMQEKDGII